MYEVTTRAFSQNAQGYEFTADIPPGVGRMALLFATSVRAATGEADYELRAPGGWTLLGAVSAAPTNRRYVTAAWALPEPAAGRMDIRIEADRNMSGLVAFLGLVDAAPGTAMMAVGPSGELLLDGPVDEGAAYLVTGRPGTVVDGTPLAQAETEESNTSTAVVGALFATGAGEVRASASKGSLVSLLAVPLAASEVPEPEPPRFVREVSVIVRDIPPGGSHEVRHVRPGDIVAGPDGIDWDATPYTAYILANEGEASE